MTSPFASTNSSTLQLLKTAETMPDIEDRSHAICATCPHPSRDHDQIAVRYCTATTNATDPNSRGCVCTTKEI
jgi:hypothetical protein